MARRAATAAALASLAVSVAAPAAHAGTTTVEHPYNNDTAWGLTAVTTSDGEGVTDRARVLTLTVSAQHPGNPTTGATTNFSFQCTAVAGVTAMGAGLTDCFARGLTSGEIYRTPSTGAKPGLADSRASVGLKLPAEPFEVCARARALYPDQTWLETPLVCGRP